MGCRASSFVSIMIKKVTKNCLFSLDPLIGLECQNESLDIRYKHELVGG